MAPQSYRGDMAAVYPYLPNGLPPNAGPGLQYMQPLPGPDRMHVPVAPTGPPSAAVSGSMPGAMVPRDQAGELVGALQPVPAGYAWPADHPGNPMTVGGDMVPLPYGVPVEAPLQHMMGAGGYRQHLVLPGPGGGNGGFALPVMQAPPGERGMGADVDAGQRLMPPASLPGPMQIDAHGWGVDAYADPRAASKGARPGRPPGGPPGYSGGGAAADRAAPGRRRPPPQRGGSGAGGAPAPRSWGDPDSVYDGGSSHSGSSQVWPAAPRPAGSIGGSSSGGHGAEERQGRKDLGHAAMHVGVHGRMPRTQSGDRVAQERDQSGKQTGGGPAGTAEQASVTRRVPPLPRGRTPALINHLFWWQVGSVGSSLSPLGTGTSGGAAHSVCTCLRVRVPQMAGGKDRKAKTVPDPRPCMHAG